MEHLISGSVAVLVLTGLVAATPAYGAATTCQGRAATITVTTNNVPVTGTDGPDVIDATGVVTALVDGRGGDDVICYGVGVLSRVHGGTGNDSIEGSAGTEYGDEGDDRLSDVDSVFGATLVPGPGDDQVLGNGESTLHLGGDAGVTISVPAGTADGEGHDTFSGLRLIVGSPGPDVFIGGAGRDEFFGDRWEDRATTAPDVVDGGGGDDYIQAVGTLRGGPGVDELRITGRGTVLGEDGNDSIWAIRGTDALAGDMRLLGGPGRDFITMDVQDSSRCDPRRCRDEIDGGPDNDLLRVTKEVRGLRIDLGAGRGRYGQVSATIGGIENVRGTGHRDVLIGDDGPNRLVGNQDDDVLVGGRGDDTLVGGVGRDRATGGPGADRCRADRTRGCER